MLLDETGDVKAAFLARLEYGVNPFVDAWEKSGQTLVNKASTCETESTTKDGLSDRRANAGNSERPNHHDAVGGVMASENLTALCPVCEQVTPGDMYLHLRTEHPRGHWGPYAGTQMTDDDAIGAGRSAIYVLGIWPTDTVHRQTVLALSQMAGVRNPAPKVARALQVLERDGLARREGEWVRILDQAALYDRAIDRLQNPSHEKFLAIETAIPAVEAEIALARQHALVKRLDEVGDLIERREAEVRFMRSLMRPYGGPMHGRGRPVRVVAAGRI